MNIILASKSGVRKKILETNNVKCEVVPSNVDEDEVKESLIKEGATPKLISKNLAELKANKISKRKQDQIVLGADSVIDLKGELISHLIVFSHQVMHPHFYNLPTNSQLKLSHLNP